MKKKSSYKSYFLGFSFLLIGLMMDVIPALANAAEHIKITKEVLLEGDHSGEPETIIRTNDGGYIVVGSIGPAWAVRTDANGNVLWRYTMAHTVGTFHGAAMLPDDSVILCGEIRIPEKNIDPKKFDSRIFGLITHLSKDGTIISERTISAANRNTHTPMSLHSIVPFESGAKIFGEVSGYMDGPPAATWIIILDGKGNIKSENLVKNIGISFLSALHDDTYVTYSINSDWRNINKLDINGEVIASRHLDGTVFPMKSVNDDALICILRSKEGRTYIETLNSKLKVVSQRQNSVRYMGVIRGYLLEDRSVMIFGQTEIGGGVIAAGMQWISSDLSQTEPFIIDPPGSVRIEDAIPTGKKGEFAAIRSVAPTQRWLDRNEKRLGIVLDFIQVK